MPFRVLLNYIDPQMARLVAQQGLRELKEAARHTQDAVLRAVLEGEMAQARRALSALGLEAEDDDAQ